MTALTCYALLETELLHRRHQLQIENAVAAVAHDEVAGPFPDQRVGRASAYGGQMREGLAHHRGPGRRIEPVPADDATTLQRQQIDGVIVIVGVDLAAVRPPQGLPVPFLDEDRVTQAKMLLDDIFVQMAICRRNCMNHESPQFIRNGGQLLPKGCRFDIGKFPSATS